MRDLVTREDIDEARVCIFVDGLDECTGETGNQLRFLLDWCQKSGTKFKIRLVFATREVQPIYVQLHEQPTCRLHEWTSHDISLYVSSKLHTTIQSIRSTGNKAFDQKFEAKLTEQVVEKAEGVFLWVTLVTEMLISDIELCKPKPQIYEALSTLPNDLKALYARVLDRIPNGVANDTINYLEILRQNEVFDRKRALDLEEFSIAVEELEQPLAESPTSSEEAESKWVNDLCENLKDRLRSTCRGLVEITPENGRKPSIRKDIKSQNVRFVHITVKHFIWVDQHWKSLLAKAGAANDTGNGKRKVSPIIDPNIILMGLQLRMLKIVIRRHMHYSIEQPKVSIESNTPLPPEHLPGCYCWTEFCNVYYPWNRKRLW